MIKRILLLFPLLFFELSMVAQENKNAAEMADTFRSNGKIYVVVAVILTIFAGIIFYLIRLDRKITRLEQKNHS